MRALMWFGSSGLVIRPGTDPRSLVGAVAVLLHHHFHDISNRILDGFLYSLLHLLVIEVHPAFAPYHLLDDHLHHRGDCGQLLYHRLCNFLCNLGGRIHYGWLIDDASGGGTSRRFPVFGEGLHQLRYDPAIAENHSYLSPRA